MRETLDAVIVGAGFAGLYALHKLRGMGLSARVIETGDDVGGTWYWNRYPGARCDVESLFYCYSFDEALANDWQWQERYAAQSEILAYINHVADRFDLRRNIRFSTRVRRAAFDEQTGRWQVETDQGDHYDARFCIMATGCLSAGRLPDIPGIGDFQGKSYHTGKWPHDPVDFTGKRVAVIGTGSSGIQTITTIAPDTERLFVFQRTPSFSAPARNGPLDPDFVAAFNAERAIYRDKLQRGLMTGFGDIMADEYLRALGFTPGAQRSPAEREAAFAGRWAVGGGHIMFTFADVLVDPDVNAQAADFVRARIREIVADPDTAEKLCPKDYPFGAKRICVDTGYYETFNRANVTLVDARATPITRITASGIETTDGDYPVDAIIYATGFDAMTGALHAIDIRGRNGLRLADAWADGPATYLGLMVAGFPNLFTITGPGSPSVLSNVVSSIEQHVDWIADCLAALDARGAHVIEATAAAQDAWTTELAATAAATLFPRAASWYMGANVPDKPRVFMVYLGVGRYREACDRIAAAGYEGFAII